MEDADIGAPDPHRGAGRYGLIAILVAASILSSLDRAIFGLMVDPIRHELGIGDTEVGLLTGFAFTLLYAFLGFPSGRWADRHNRRLLIVAGMVVWSLATAACGLAHGFAGLFGARLMVGVGEATLGPSALSLVANVFPRHRLGMALALLATAITLGNGVSITFGGELIHWAQPIRLQLPVIGELGAWRLVFVLLGLIGLPMALLTALLLREPARQPGTAAPNVKALFAHILGDSRTYGLVVAGYSLMVVMSFAQGAWGPTYFMRIHHMPIQRFAAFYGLLMGIGGTIGLLAGGAWSDAWTRRRISAAPARVNLIAVLLQGPFLVAGYLSRDLGASLALYGCGVIILTFTGSLQSATFQRITPPRMLGSVSALYLIFANLVGGGLGPVLIGALSQHFSPAGTGLGQALAVVAVITLPPSALLIFLALKPIAASEASLVSRATS
jgi:MFS family permease